MFSIFQGEFEKGTFFRQGLDFVLVGGYQKLTETAAIRAFASRRSSPIDWMDIKCHENGVFETEKRNHKKTFILF